MTGAPDPHVTPRELTASSGCPHGAEFSTAASTLPLTTRQVRYRHGWATGPRVGGVWPGTGAANQQVLNQVKSRHRLKPDMNNLGSADDITGPAAPSCPHDVALSTAESTLPLTTSQVRYRHGWATSPRVGGVCPGPSAANRQALNQVKSRHRLKPDANGLGSATGIGGPTTPSCPHSVELSTTEFAPPLTTRQVRYRHEWATGPRVGGVWPGAGVGDRQALDRVKSWPRFELDANNLGSADDIGGPTAPSCPHTIAPSTAESVPPLTTRQVRYRHEWTTGPRVGGVWPGAGAVERQVLGRVGLAPGQGVLR